VSPLAKAIVRGERLRGTYGNSERKRPMVTLTLSPEALARLDAIASARGQSRSGAVEQLIRRARLGSDGK
jgi:DNA-binding TFAR19-related protein (PDSD5 family)